MGNLLEYEDVKPLSIPKQSRKVYAQLLQTGSAIALGGIVAAGALGFPLPEVLAPIPPILYGIGKALQPKEARPFEPEESSRRTKTCILRVGKQRWIEPFISLGFTEDGQEIVIPFSKLTRHVLLLGTTGAGKTTTIRKLIHSVMLHGGGATFVDGKADTTDTYGVFCQIVEECDRRDDFFVINFLNPLQSNTINPLLYGDSEFLTELLAVFLGSKGFWGQKGLALLRGLMSVLVWMRDHDDNGHFKPRCRPFTFWDIKKYMVLEKCLELAKMVEDNKIPRRDETGMPIGERLIGFLNDQGPWRELLKPNPNMMVVDQVIKQFQFAVQQWTAALDLLGGAFAPIFCSYNPDVDMRDIIQNSRILYVLLPALGKSETTLQQMGKLLLGIIKTSLDEMLGKETVGKADVVEQVVKRVRPPLPHICILDEYGSYAVEGFSTVLAQARSLNYAVVISAQEIGRLMKENLKAEGEALLANTNIKLFMKIADDVTAEKAVKLTKKKWKLVPTSVRIEHGFLKEHKYIDSYAVQRVEALQPHDLFKLKPGELYMVYEGNAVKLKVPYVKGKMIKGFGVLKPLPYKDFLKIAYTEEEFTKEQSTQIGDPKEEQEEIKKLYRVIFNSFAGRPFLKVNSYSVFTKMLENLGVMGIRAVFGVKDQESKSHLATEGFLKNALRNYAQNIMRTRPCLALEKMKQRSRISEEILEEAQKTLEALRRERPN